MASENIAVLYANDAEDTKVTAARLMSEALSRPEDAEALIAMAIQLFQQAKGTESAEG